MEACGQVSSLDISVFSDMKLDYQGISNKESVHFDLSVPPNS
jgi:hypothetical protein